MCGIAGVVGKVKQEVIHNMLYAQKHRGPDNTSVWVDDIVQLGHNRLSIIDLSEEANQPFENENYVLVFNGEIYNYIELKSELKDNYFFKTNSDTEVLLAAYIKWGEGFLHKLNGMFAFAIWDKKEQTLFAARDRFGVKPFYYSIKDEVLYFSSEIKTLFAAGIFKEPNKKVWANYFAHGSYGLPNESFWKNIHQLPASHVLNYKKNIVNIEKWYVFEDEVKKYFNLDLSYKEVKEKYTKLLKNSISLRFRADVTVGFNVSGGLDSSALLAFVNQQEKSENIQAFTFYTNDERYDELHWVQEMIALTNNPLHKVLLQAEDVEGLSKTITFHQDEPFGGIPTLAYSKIFDKARKEGVLVLLDGQGMDEQWAGYDYYLSSTDTSTIQGVQKSPFRKNVLTKELLNYIEKPEYPEPFKDELLNKQYRDLFYTKIPRALRFNDRVSMAYSTELREPFLDYRLVEFAFAQPEDFKINKGVQKKMLRDIVSEYLSDSITYAPKRPLQTPQREWLGNDLEKFVTNRIEMIEKSKFSYWFNIEELKTEWKNYLNGDNQSSFHIWQWLSFSLNLD
jgi:asparagine synthase (glutamine-hydrolysing)